MPEALKLDCLPYDKVDFSRVLDALATRGFLVKYACRGREYGFVRTFKKHQVINNKESASELPSPEDASEIVDDSTREPRVPDASTTRSDLVQGEGNGLGREQNRREGNDREGGLALPRSPAPSPAPIPLGEPRKRRPKTRKDPLRDQIDSAATWDAYRVAYVARYECEPTRNAKVNGQVSHFLQRVPREEAPDIAAHYVTSNNLRYVSAGHGWGDLLRDAEKLRTEWLTGRTGTLHGAREADRRAGRGAQYDELIGKLQREEAAS